MDGTIFGMYDFSNDTLVDPSQRNSGGDVFMHEYTHKIISGFSSMGLLLIMMKKASLLDRDKQWLCAELIKLVREVQEVTATTVEHYHIYETKGDEAFRRALRQLGGNKEYLRYYNRLYDIHRSVRSEEDAAGLIPVLMLLAVWSMNLDFSEFPLWTFQSGKDLAKFLEKPGMRERYYPTARFRILADYFLRNDRRQEVQDRFQQVSNYSFQGNPTRHCFETACKIYQNSPLLPRIKRRIRKISIDPDSIEIVEDVQSMSLSAYPVDLNDSQYKREYRFCDVSTCRQKLRDDPNLLLIFQHKLGGVEELTMLACAGSKPEVLLSFYTEADLPALLSLPNQIVFTRGKLVRELRPMLQQCERKPYILMDSGMAGNLNFIYQEFQSGTFTCLPYDKHIVLLIYNDRYTLFQPVFQEALPAAMRLLKSHGIRYVEYGVSGYYGDPVPALLAGYNRDTASDARNILQRAEENALHETERLD